MPTIALRANPWLFTATLLGGLAVACGAFGAHGLKAHFASDGEISRADELQLNTWETAVRYQMYHALALLAGGVLAPSLSRRLLQLAGLSMTAGTVIFSGCLYVLVLTGQRWLGAVVPIGGLLMILGWLLLAVAALGSTKP